MIAGLESSRCRRGPESPATYIAEEAESTSALSCIVFLPQPSMLYDKSLTERSEIITSTLQEFTPLLTSKSPYFAEQHELIIMTAKQFLADQQVKAFDHGC